MFESAGVPLLTSIVLHGRQPQKIEAYKWMLYYVALAALPFLVLVLNRSTRVCVVMSSYTVFVLMPFLAKTPAFILHLWLPKAHVEASTSGSIVLASRVMKLGTYGLLICGGPVPYFRSVVTVRICLGVLITAAPLIRNNDLKSLVAYSRVLHMAGGVLA